jgi:hypothetical protein
MRAMTMERPDGTGDNRHYLSHQSNIPMTLVGSLLQTLRRRAPLVEPPLLHLHIAKTGGGSLYSEVNVPPELAPFASPTERNCGLPSCCGKFKGERRKSRFRAAGLGNVIQEMQEHSWIVEEGKRCSFLSFEFQMWAINSMKALDSVKVVTVLRNPVLRCMSAREHDSRMGRCQLNVNGLATLQTFGHGGTAAGGCLLTACSHPQTSWLHTLHGSNKAWNNVSWLYPLDMESAKSALKSVMAMESIEKNIRKYPLSAYTLNSCIYFVGFTAVP